MGFFKKSNHLTFFIQIYTSILNKTHIDQFVMLCLIYSKAECHFLEFTPISLRYILIVSSYLHLDRPKSLFGSFTHNIMKSLLSFRVLVTYPTHLNIPNLIPRTLLSQRYRPQSSSSRSLLHSPLSSFLGQNIGLRILFPNTLACVSHLM
jgi:hypothetical protein